MEPSIESTPESQPEETPVAYGPGKAIVALLAFYLGSVAGSMFCGMAVGMVNALSGVDFNDPVAVEAMMQPYMPAIIVVSTLAGAAVLGFYLKVWLPDLWLNPGESGLCRTTPRALLVGAAAGVTVSALVQAIMRANPPPSNFESGPLATMASGNLAGVVAWVLLALGIAPWLEEILFRGVFFTGLARRWGRVVSGIVVTVVFLLLHWSEAGGYAAALLGIASLGVMTVVFRVRTGSIWPSVACHFCYNAVVAALVMWPVLFPSLAVQAARLVVDGKSQEALQVLGKAIEEEPERSDLYYLRAAVRAEADLLEGSLADYSKCIDLKAENMAAALNGRSYTLARLGRYQEAMPDIERSLKLKPAVAGHLDTLGYVKVGLKDYEGALEAYNQALEIDSELAVVLYGKAVCLRELGHREQAEALFQEVQELEPGFELDWPAAKP